MTQEISQNVPSAIGEQRYLVMLKGGLRCLLTQKQKLALAEELVRGKERILIDDFYFNGNDISFVLPIEEVNKQKEEDIVVPNYAKAWVKETCLRAEHRQKGGGLK